MMTLPSKTSLRRKQAECNAERVVRREPALANSLGRVVPAAWTAAGLALAAIPWGKPAGAGCAPSASAERSGSPGLLNVGRGQTGTQLFGIPAASMSASIVTPTDAGPSAAQPTCCTHLKTHFRCKCLQPVFTDTCGHTFQPQRLGLAGRCGARFGSRLRKGA